MHRRRLARTAAAFALAIAILVSGAALVLRLGAVRAAIIARANAALAQVFAGRLTIERVGAIGLTWIDGVDVRVAAPDGATVLRATGLRARWSLGAALRTALAGSGAVAVTLPEASIDRAELTIGADEDGVTIAQAFRLRPRSSGGAPGRPVRVDVEVLRLRHVIVHGRPRGGAPVDVDVHDAEGALRVDDGVVTADLHDAAVSVDGLPAGIVARGSLGGRVVSPALQVRAHWDGAVGAVKGVADFAYAEGVFDASVDVPHATSADLRTVWPECPLRVPVRVHAEAHGPFTGFRASVRATVDAGTADVDATVSLGAGAHAAIHTDVRAFDARSVLASAPDSSITASGDGDVQWTSGGTLSARAGVRLLEGRWGGLRLPPAALTAVVERAPGAPLSARGDLTIREPGAPTRAHVGVDSSGGSPALTFDVQTSIPHIEHWSRASGAVSGGAVAHAAGRFDLATRTIEAHGGAVLTSLAVPRATLGTARLAATIVGPVDRPSFDAEVEGEDLESGALRVAAVRAHARGAWSGRAAAFRDVEIEAVGRDGGPASARAATLQIGIDGLDAEDVVVDGLGAPVRGWLRTSPSHVAVRAESSGVDLARVAAFVRMPVSRGAVSLDIDGAVTAGSADGRAAIDLRHAAWPGADDANAKIEAVVHGRHAAGHAVLTVDDVGRLEVNTSSIEIGRGPLVTASPWRHAWGSVGFEGQVDLARLEAKLPRAGRPLDAAGGVLHVDGRVARDSAADPTPGVEISAHTERLVLEGRNASWHLEGVDPTATLRIDGDTGRTVLDASVTDRAGTAATLEAVSTAVPYAVLLSDANPVDALRAMPFDARIDVGPHPLGSLPPLLDPKHATGDLRAEVTWHGSLAAPSVDAAALLSNVRVDPTLVTRPFDASMAAHYDGARLDVGLRTAMDGRAVLDASARVDAHAADVLAGLRGAARPWAASARVRLDKWPLRSLAPFENAQVRGTVSGEATVDGWHDDARASAWLTFDGVRVGELPCRSSTVQVTADGHAIDVAASLDHGDGSIQARGHAAARWGAAAAPSIDATGPASASVAARSFRAAFLLPFVSRWMSELDGRVSGNAQVRYDPRTGAISPQGEIALDQGSFELPSFGGRFHGASARLVMTPDRVIQLKDAVAHGVTGTLEAAATARLDGSDLAGARVALVMPAGDPLPLVIEGVQLGTIDGSVNASVTRATREGGLRVDVDVARAHVQLPSGPSSSNVQTLGDLPGVDVGVRGSDGQFVPIALDAPTEDDADRQRTRRAPTTVAVRLGDVQVTRGTDLDVRLEGQPTVRFDGDTRVTGQIRMLRGSIDVQGKAFSIDNGTVTFVGADASNPQVVLSASWTAPDSTRVIADFVGPLKTGKVTLRSEPPRPQREIVALLLFGTTDDPSQAGAGATPPQVSTAMAAAGGAATQSINRALGGVNRALGSLGIAGGISTRIDTSQTNPRPEVEVRIARDISLQIAWVLGVPPPGTNPDSTLVTLDWHFLGKWSLETTVGDAGTSIFDLVWQHRY